MISREEAITRILANNDQARKLVAQVHQLQSQTAQQCEQIQSEINQLIGKNDGLRELFGIEVEELQKILNQQAEQQRRPAKPETRQQRRVRERAAKANPT